MPHATKQTCATCGTCIRRTVEPNIYNDIYIKTAIDTLFSNIDLNNYYTETEIDDLDNELSTLKQ